MSEHSLPMPDLNEHKVPNESFWSWIKTQTALFYSQIAVFISLVLYFSTISYYFFGYHIGETDLKVLLHEIQDIFSYVNLAVCFLFVIISIFILHKNRYGRHQVELFSKRFNKEMNKAERNQHIDEAEEKLFIFKKLFLFYWINGIAYYFSDIVLSIYFPNNPRLLDFFDLLFNNLGFTIIYACYRLLNYPSHRKIIISFTKCLKWFTINLIIAILAYAFWKTNTHLENTIKPKIILALSGILFMISISMLTYTLDNKIIGLSSVLICVLFGYAAIQPFEFATNSKDFSYETISTTIGFLAFIFKIYFFSIITFTSQTGRLLNLLNSKSVLENKFEKIRY